MPRRANRKAHHCHYAPTPDEMEQDEVIPFIDGVGKKASLFEVLDSVSQRAVTSTANETPAGSGNPDPHTPNGR